MFDLWHFVLFLSAAGVLALMPGPGIFYVAARTLAGGRGEGLASSFGTGLGGFVHIIAGAIGVSAIVMASAEAFTALKVAGALYLVYLGIKTWRAPVPATLDESASLQHGGWRIMAHTFTATALNPGGIVFYVAFFPQFLSADKPLLTQVAVFGATFVVMGTLNSILYATLALQVRRLVTSYRARKTMNRATGAFLITMGGLVGLAKRAA